MIISIPTPCHEDWNGVTPTPQGAFCAACSKNVVDFTAMADDELKDYFLQHRHEKTCGRFRNDQVKNEEIDLPKLIASTIPYWQKFLAAMLILFRSLFTSCDNTPKTGKALITDTTITHSYPFPPAVGEPKIRNDTNIVESICTTVGNIISIIIPDSIAPVGQTTDTVKPILLLGDVKTIDLDSEMVVPSPLPLLKRDTMAQPALKKDSCDRPISDSSRIVT